MDPAQLQSILSGAVRGGVSDIHLQPGQIPAFRLRGDLVPVKSPPITDQDIEGLLPRFFPGERLDPAKISERDGSFDVPGLARFRFNLFRFGGHLGVVLRVISSAIPTFEQLGLPGAVQRIASMHRGLVLVTGVTGSGKSSTLAAMIDYINAHFRYHVLTIEDPIEFLHPQRKSRITQRELGTDTKSYADALRAALRQDPDVILVGEMRDAETVDVALKAAETGHLVFSTVHTTDCIKTIGRLISYFPTAEQAMARHRLADNLVATISQRLLKRVDGSGLVPAMEIMIANAGIRECIVDPDRTNTINDFIHKSRELQGGQLFDWDLARLFKEGRISIEEAKAAATNPSDFERNLQYENNVAPVVVE